MKQSLIKCLIEELTVMARTRESETGGTKTKVQIFLI